MGAELTDFENEMSEDEWMDALVFYSDLAERLSETKPETSDHRKALTEATKHAEEKSRQIGMAVKLHNDEWGCCINDGSDIEVGEFVEVQIVTRTGKTWPAWFEIFWEQDSCYFGRKFL